MANLPETESYDVGVYQIETTDPVEGGANGVDNAPLKNLANRTKYLKKHLDDLESAAEGFAPLADPELTGSPTAPTQSLGDNSTKIATDAFVQSTVGGRLVKSVAGNSNVTLTAIDAGNAILEFTGVLTGAIAVIVPASPTRSWIVKNGTSGAYTLTVKTASGSGQVCTQGTTAMVFTDGTNVYDALTDFDSPALTGSPTAPTAAQFDESTLLATTAFVKRLGLQASTRIFKGVGSSVLAADAGKLIQLSVDNADCTLPAVSSVPVGAAFTFSATTGGASTSVKTSGTDVMTFGTVAKTAVTLQNGDSLILIASSNGYWVAAGLGSAALQYAASFGASLASSGYQKLPSGLIIQWGTALVSLSGATVTFPLVFPSECYGVVLGNAFSTNVTFSATSIGAASFIGSSSSASSGSVPWIAIGK